MDKQTYKVIIVEDDPDWVERHYPYVVFSIDGKGLEPVCCSTAQSVLNTYPDAILLWNITKS